MPTGLFLPCSAVSEGLADDSCVPHSLFIAFCNDLLFGDTPHLGENLADSFINDLIQNVDGISRLPGAVGLLAELSVTGIANTQRIV